MREVASRRVEEQQRYDDKKGQDNDGSEPRELEEDGPARRGTRRAALRRCLCHAGILSQIAAGQASG
jgi:hypothetical protein